MIEATANIKTADSGRLSQWVFNPFRFIAGFKALLLGLAIILISAFIGSLSNTHFDGVIDVHTGAAAPMWFFLAEGVINWVCMVIPLFFFGLIVSRSAFRMIDVLGTQALARWPYSDYRCDNASGCQSKSYCVSNVQAYPDCSSGRNWLYRCVNIRVCYDCNYSYDNLDGRIDVSGIRGILQYKRCEGGCNFHCQFNRGRGVV